MFTGTWDEIREATFTACLLAYGPRPNVPRGDLEGGLDRLFEWDTQVFEYLAPQLLSSQHPLFDRRKLYTEYLTWLEGNDEQQTIQEAAAAGD